MFLQLPNPSICVSVFKPSIQICFLTKLYILLFKLPHWSCPGPTDFACHLGRGDITFAGLQGALGCRDVTGVLPMERMFFETAGTHPPCRGLGIRLQTFFCQAFEWFAFRVIPGTRTQVRFVDWTGCLEAWQRPRPHYTSQRRWSRVLASRHVQGGCCLVRVGLMDARPGRWLLRDLQAELPTGRGFLDVGGDPKPGSRYDIFFSTSGKA